MNALKMAINSLKYGVCIEAGLELLRFIMLLVKKRNIKFALADLLTFSFEKLRIPLFLMINSLSLRGSHCLFKCIRKKNDWVNSVLSGIVCGLASMPFLKHNKWYLILSLLAARIVDALYRIAIAKGILNEQNSKLHFYTMFAIGNIINAYGFFIEGDIIESDMVSLYKRMAALDYKENQWLKSCLYWTGENMKKKGYIFLNNKLEKRISELANDPRKIAGF
jgi:hypothetical protein